MMEETARWLIISFCVMNMAGCFSIASALLYEEVGPVPVSASMMVFSAALTAIIVLSAKWLIDIKESERCSQKDNA
jgi:hypothetical protein